MIAVVYILINYLLRCKMNIKNIKKSMKLAMAHRDINQKELSIASGVGELTISRISQEKIMPTMETIEKLATATDYTLIEFLALSEVKEIDQK